VANPTNQKIQKTSLTRGSSCWAFILPHLPKLGSDHQLDSFRRDLPGGRAREIASLQNATVEDQELSEDRDRIFPNALYQLAHLCPVSCDFAHAHDRVMIVIVKRYSYVVKQQAG
jgi:hypothetical protein